MHIGLIGGIGVAATIVYYQRLTDAVARRGKTLDLTIVHADVQELIRTNLADLREEQARNWLPLLVRLKAAGCDVAAVTSLGGHFCFDELQAISPLPLISAVTPLDAHFAEQGHATVGLLGTRVVMRTKLTGSSTRPVPSRWRTRSSRWVRHIRTWRWRAHAARSGVPSSATPGKG